MHENEIACHIVDAAYAVHTKLGPGLLESAYESVLAYELQKRGLRVSRQVPCSIVYEELVCEDAFRMDLLVEEKVLVELKSVEKLARVHSKQLLTYLKLADKRLGLLINFGEALLRDGITRIANNLQE